MDDLIGKKVIVTYGDQNIRFESIFPKTGEIISQHKDQHSNDWYLIELEKPFEYENKINEQILVRSRWQNHTLHDKTSVNVLLIPDPGLLKNNPIIFEDFEHVVWAETEIL